MRPVVLWGGSDCTDAQAIKKVLADFSWANMEEIPGKLEHLKNAFAATSPGRHPSLGEIDLIPAFVDVRRTMEGIAGQFTNIELPLRRYERALQEVHFGKAEVWADGSIVELNHDGSVRYVPHW